MHIPPADSGHTHSSFPEKWRNPGLNALIFGLLLMRLYQLVMNNDAYDDAYMFLRYANNFLSDGTIGWNPGERSFGCTSLPYLFFNVLLLASGLQTSIHGGYLLSFHSFLWGMAALVCIYQSIRLLVTSETLKNIAIAKLTIIVLLLAGTFFYNLNSGMDTGMAMFANALLIYASIRVFRKPTLTKMALLALAAYFAFLVRPDSGLYAFLFPGLMLLNRKDLRNGIAFYTCVVLLLALDSLLKYAYFGHVLPLPFYVKSWGYYDAYLDIGLWNYFRYLRELAIDLSPLLFLSVLLFHKRMGATLLPFLLPVLLTYLYFCTVVQIMGSFARFYAPGIPFLVIACILVIDQGLSQARYRLHIGAALVISALTFTGLSLTGGKYFHYLTNKAAAQAAGYAIDLGKNPHLPTLGWFQSQSHFSKLLTRLPEDISVAASEHGLISFEHPRTPILCLAGLHNNLVADPHIPKTALTDSSLRKTRPELIWMAPKSYAALHYDMLRSGFFRQHYDYYPDFLDYGIAIDRQSPHRDTILAYLREVYDLAEMPQPVSYVVP